MGRGLEQIREDSVRAPGGGGHRIGCPLRQGGSEGPGRRRGGDGPGDPARRRLLRLCQRRLDEGDRHSPRSRRLRLLHGDRRRGDPADRGPDPGGGQDEGPRGLARGAGRRVLRRLDERGGDREARPRAVESGSRRHRGDHGRGLARARPRRGASRGRRLAQQHELPHEPSVRALGLAGLRPSGKERRLPAAGRAGHARPRQLPRHRREVRRAPGKVQGPHRRAAQARRAVRRRGPRRPDLRPREKDRRRPRQPGRLARRAQGEQSVAAAGICKARAGARLGRVLRRGRPLRAADADGLAPVGDDRHRGAGGKGTARRVEGLPDLPCDQPRLAAAAEGVRRGGVPVLRHGAFGSGEAARPVEARGRSGERRSGRRRGPALRREVLPALVQGAGARRWSRTSRPRSGAASTP